MERSPDGSLPELPVAYQPAAIEIAPAGPDKFGRPVPRVAVRLSGVEHVLEPCVAELFLRPQSPPMRLLSSWYHDFSLLPPYIVVDLPSQTIEDEMFSGYSVLFDLRTAKIIELRMVVATSGVSGDADSRAFGASSRSIPAYEAICGQRSESTEMWRPTGDGPAL